MTERRPYIPYNGAVVIRKTAIELGLKHYFTGKLCKRGHLFPKNLSGRCLECLRLDTANNRNKVNNGTWITPIKVNQTKMVERECRFCNRTFTMRWIPAYDKIINFGTFCSRLCSMRAIKRPYPAVIEITCKECGNKSTKRLKNRNTNTYEFCSRQCANIAKAKWMNKENHPRWMGGKSRREGLVAKVCRERVKQVGHCERCGSIENLHGHHKLHFATHPEERSNPDNIEVLCSVCHSKEHPELQSFIALPHKKNGTYLPCEQCGKTIYRRPLGANRFCSSKCRVDWHRGRSKEEILAAFVPITTTGKKQLNKQCSLCKSTEHKANWHKDWHIHSAGGKY